MNWRTLILDVSVALLAGAIAIGCNKPAGASANGFPPPLVSVATSTARDVPVYLDEIGKCAARESVTITPQVAGQIVTRDFEDGADLKEDQLLFTIDIRPFKAALASAQAQLAQANAALDFAKIELERYASVANTKAISKADYDTKKNAVDVADAQVSAAQAAVETARLNLDYCSIRSPIDGRAGARLVDAGNIVKANETALLLVQRLDPIYADFTITERDLPEVQKQMASHTLKTLVRLPVDRPGSGREGELIFLDNSVQDGTGTVKLRAMIPNQDHHFWPGQFVDIRLILMTQKDAVLVPNPATQISQDGPFVFVIKADDTAERRLVTLGQRQGADVVILSGVAAGERVVTAGQNTVKPGDKVRIDTGSASAGAPAQTQPGATEGGQS